MSVHDFPKQEIPSPVFEVKDDTHPIVIEGREIPKLRGMKLQGKYWLVLDRRFGIEVPEELVHPVLHMIANAMAIGAGYPWFGADSKDAPFASQVMELGSVEFTHE